MATYFKEEDNHLVATFEFKDFVSALQFVNAVGALFEKHHHHGDVALYDYKFVTITSCTHSKGNTVTDKDHALIADIELLFSTK